MKGEQYVEDGVEMQKRYRAYPDGEFTTKPKDLGERGRRENKLETNETVLFSVLRQKTAFLKQ